MSTAHNNNAVEIHNLVKKKAYDSKSTWENYNVRTLPTTEDRK
jgi:hypothetical protein